MSAHFERYRDDAGEYRYRLRSANGEIVLPNESVTRSEDIIRQIEQMIDVLNQAAPPPAHIIKITDADDGLPDGEDPDLAQPENDDEPAPEEA